LGFRCGVQDLQGEGFRVKGGRVKGGRVKGGRVKGEG